MSDLLDQPVTTLDGTSTTLGGITDGRAALIVNVASRCGLTPQYAKLEALQAELGDRGFTVVGFPCNQFGGQEPGTAEEIQEFCSNTWGVTFPLFEKIDVNGADRHPLFAALTEAADSEGTAGDVEWNFEKFLVSRDGSVIGRFRTRTEPDDPDLLAAVEHDLAA
jgi:glutathione peroxidase